MASRQFDPSQHGAILQFTSADPLEDIYRYLCCISRILRKKIRSLNRELTQLYGIRVEQRRLKDFLICTYEMLSELLQLSGEEVEAAWDFDEDDGYEFVQM